MMGVNRYFQPKIRTAENFKWNEDILMAGEEVFFYEQRQVSRKIIFVRAFHINFAKIF